jgi:hypothetical protein
MALAVATAAATGALLPAGAARAATPTSTTDYGVTVDRSIIPGRIVVKASGRPGLRLAASARPVAPDTVTLSVPPAATSEVLAELNRDPTVEYAEPDRWVRADAVPNDPRYFSDQASYLNVIEAPRAWDITMGSSAVLVAVLDTRVDTTHVDLTGKVIDGGNLVDPLNDGVNGCGSPGINTAVAHGTFVSGIIGARTNNATGVAGLGWNTRVLAVRALNDFGCGSESDLAAAIRSATDQGAAIENMSLSGPGSSTVLNDAVAYAQGRGVILVAAAGNDASSIPRYPAALPGVLSVGASDKSDQTAGFSNRGPWVDLMAPGDDISSTIPGGYGTGDGTSFASPIAAAAAALIVAAHPGITPAGVFSRLQRGAVAIAGTGTDSAWGRLDIGASLALGTVGFRVTTSLGEVGAYGDATYLGSMAGVPLVRPVVGIASTHTGNGYWLVAGDGGIFSFGDAQFHGSTGNLKLNKPVVGLSATASGNGYWFVATDGGIFSYGDAVFYGSTGAMVLNKPVVGMARTPSGNGYWLVASDGGIFTFGDAEFFGSTGATVLNKPIVGMAPSKSGRGYWLVASDGGIFAFGDAPFLGGTGGLLLGQPIAGMSVTATGNGYWLVSGDGTIYPEGDAPPLGSAAGVFAASLVSLAAI